MAFEEMLLNLGGYGVALYILWDSNRKIAASMDNVAWAMRSCPIKKDG